MRRLIDEFGEKRAREIMGDTRPVERRKPVPSHVGVKDKPLPALTRSGGPTGNPGWQELRDLDKLNDRKNPVQRVQIQTFRKAGKCHGCGSEIVAGTEAMRVIRVSTSRWFCMACGTEEARRG